MDRMKEEIMDLLDKLEDVKTSNKDLHIVKFVLIENILKVGTFGGLTFIKRLVNRIKRIIDRRHGLESKVNNLRKYMDNK